NPSPMRCGHRGLGNWTRGDGPRSDPARASCRATQELLAGQFKNGHGQLAGDAREPVEKVIQRIPGLEVVKEGLHRNAGPEETGGPTEPLGVDPDGAVTRIAGKHLIAFESFGWNRILVWRGHGSCSRPETIGPRPTPCPKNRVECCEPGGSQSQRSN